MKRSYTLEYLIVSLGAAVILSLLLFSGLIPYGAAYLGLGLGLLAAACCFSALADRAILRRKRAEEADRLAVEAEAVSVSQAA
ncbi:MAG: hypothetical protein LKJ86_07950 [Oscillibacter sp.]|jgi:hypothetical protein|nr:hypothetical protein [Oscillibacter sp.]